MNTQTRFVNRLGDHTRQGAEYGCSITRYASRPDYAHRSYEFADVFLAAEVK